MYCKLCGEHLYEKITFTNIFKYHYNIHDECERKLNNMDDYITFPLLDRLILRDYLFEERSDTSDIDYLYRKYSYLFYERMMKTDEWSVVIITDIKLSNTTMILIIKLADDAILFCSVFNENIF